MRIAVLLLLLASCGPKHLSASEADTTVADDRRRFDATFTAAIAKARSDAGTNLLELATEVLPEDGAPVPPLVSAPNAPDVMLLEKVGPDGTPRLAHVIPPGDPCSGRHTAQFVYARGANGRVRVIVIEPRPTHQTIHVKGACGMPGCGAQPPPPPLMLVWLPVTSRDAIDVERRVVEGTLHHVTCDQPQYPP